MLFRSELKEKLNGSELEKEKAMNELNMRYTRLTSIPGIASADVEVRDGAPSSTSTHTDSDRDVVGIHSKTSDGSHECAEVEVITKGKSKAGNKRTSKKARGARRKLNE